MSKSRRIIFVLVMGVVFVIFCIYFYQNKQACRKNSTINKAIVENELDIVFGKDTAKLEMYMYLSYSCVYCRKFLNEVYPKIENDFINTGKVKFIIKPIELSNDANMIHALKTAVCINEYGNFEKLNKLLVMEPTVIYTKDFLLVTDEFIEKDASVAQCMLDGTAENYLANNLTQFKHSKLTGTPSFVINNKTYKGFKPYTFFQELLELELAKK